MIKILTIDDHAVVRNGVKILFAESAEPPTFGEAGDGETAARLVREQNWDVVVLDITLGNRSGIEVMKELHSIRPGLPV